MSSRLSAEICRVRAPEKLPDRLLLSGVIGSTAATSLGDHFVIAYLFEISRPWLPSSQVLPELANILKEEHTKLNATDNLDDQFEALLRAVNQTLNKVSESGETDWIGNLNGLIILLGKEELHFSQTGRCPAYLLQNNRIRQITDDLNEKDPHPLKTFSNLASGNLQPGDKILIANMELYSEISLDALRRILNTNTPFTACQSIAKELKRDKNSKVSAVLASFKSFDESTPITTEPTVVDMEEELQGNAKKVYRKLKPVIQATKERSRELSILTTKVAQQIGAASIKVAKTAHKAAKERVLPGANALISKGSSKLMGGSARTQPVIETILPENKMPPIASSAIVNLPEVPVDQTIGTVIPASELALEGTDSQDVLEPKTLSIQTLIATAPALLKEGWILFVVWMRVPRNKKITALIIGILLVGAVVIGALRQKNHPAVLETLNTNTTILNTIRNNESKITTALASSQSDQANSLISSSLTQLNDLANPTSDQKQQATALWNTLTAQADSITKTTRFSATQATYTFPGTPQSFFAGLPYFYGFAPQSNALIRTGSGTLSTIQASINLPDTNDVITAITPSTESDTNGYILTKQSKVYRVVQSGTATNILPIQPVSGSFATGTSIATYSGNVYILDGNSGLLWRYLNNGTSYAQGVMIIDVNKINLLNSVSLAIDGSIYVLHKDGSIIKLTSSKIDPNFSIKNVPALSQTLIRPLQIIASPDYSDVYVLDGGDTSSSFSTAKVLMYDKNGNYLGQYAFPANYTNVSAFDISPKDNKIWVLNGKTISEFSL